MMIRLILTRAPVANPVPQDTTTGGNPQIPWGPPHFHAMGDSYSAGPGAGNKYDDAKYGGNKCFRGTGAYGPKLDALNLDALGKFQFLSCTGHVTADVNQYQFPDLQYHEVNSDMRVTLSIGGNDLLFSDYLKACLLNLPLTNCDDTKAKINNLIDNTDGENTFYNGLSKVWSAYREGSWPYRVPRVYQTLYPKFFHDDTDYCDNVRISLGKLFFGPKMTKELRAEVNDFVGRANDKIIEHQHNWQNADENYWALGHFSTVDYNDKYDADDGHRLCAKYVNDGVGFSNPDVWFLGVAQSDHDDDDENSGQQGDIEDSLTIDQMDPNTCDQHAGDLGLSVACTMAVYKSQNPNANISDFTLPKWLTKSFHPKSSGFNRARDSIRDAMFPSRRPSLRVLPLGGAITFGDGSSSGNGYRERFVNLSSSERQTEMIGSVKSGSMPDNDNEGHDGATIDDVTNFANESLHLYPNVVLLYAGGKDMDSDDGANGAPDRLANLIDRMFISHPDITCLVSLLIPDPDPAKQARVDAFNSAVTDLVNSRRDSGVHIQLARMNEVVPLDHVVNGFPNDDAYRAMGEQFYSGVMYADNQGWINDPTDLLVASAVADGVGATQ